MPPGPQHVTTPPASFSTTAPSSSGALLVSANRPSCDVDQNAHCCLEISLGCR
jgi:hypothetical protein